LVERQRQLRARVQRYELDDAIANARSGEKEKLVNFLRLGGRLCLTPEQRVALADLIDWMQIRKRGQRSERLRVKRDWIGRVRVEEKFWLKRHPARKRILRGMRSELIKEVGAQLAEDRQFDGIKRQITEEEIYDALAHGKRKDYRRFR
jgi:hypothetical protein